MEMSKKEFGQAVFEGICQMQEAVLANTEDNTDCSARHKRIMKIIADKRVSPSMAARLLSKKKVLLAFIAAATIVLSCTVYAFRNEIRAIVEQIFDDHVHVEFEGENVVEKIEKEYTVNYLPEGYELVYERKTPSHIYYQWENPDGEVIEFKQSLVGNPSFFIDAEHGLEKIKLQNIEMEIYCVKDENRYTAIWNDGNYALSLFCTEDISDEEFLRLIEGVS